MVNGLPDATRVLFDDERVVANAGVLLPALLAGRLGIEGLVEARLISATGTVRSTRVAR